jgi:SAM-dependent methyltransferase
MNKIIDGIANRSRVASYWDDHVGEHINSFSHWEGTKPVQMHQWKHVTGDPNYNPVAWFWHKYGPFERSASIACGNGILERYVAENLLPPDGRITGFDVSPASVKLARSLSKSEGADFDVRDMNHQLWDEATYDAVFAHGALHHVEALDFCLGEMAKSLKPTGLLYVNDYLGPARFQFSETQLRLANDLLLRVPEKFRSGNTPKNCDPVALSHMDPSEAVNPHQIYETLRAHFDIVERHAMGGTLLAPIFGGSCLDPAIVESSEGLEVISMLAETERAMIDEGWIRSDHVLLVCRKP